VAEPVRVGDLLAEMPGLHDRMAEARLVETWPTIAGAAAARSRAEGVDQGVLQVAVDSSGWLHRLTLEESRLIARCREIAAIRSIRFRLVAPPDPAVRAVRSSLPAVEGEVCS
jgi:predicted nucleic acid-binding Zn ribbon protein